MPGADLLAAYKILCVTPSDDAATVRRAWLRLVRAYHPDMYKGDKAAANKKLAEINAAFDLVEAAVAKSTRPNRTEEYVQARRSAKAKREARAFADRVKAAEKARRAHEEAAKRQEEGRRQAEIEAEIKAQEARYFEAELEKLKAEREVLKRRASFAHESRSARRSDVSSSWSKSDEVAARVAEIAFITARKALEAERRARFDRSVYA